MAGEREMPGMPINSRCCWAWAKRRTKEKGFVVQSPANRTRMAKEFWSSSSSSSSSIWRKKSGKPVSQNVYNRAWSSSLEYIGAAIAAAMVDWQENQTNRPWVRKQVGRQWFLFSFHIFSLCKWLRYADNQTAPWMRIAALSLTHRHPLLFYITQTHTIDAERMGKCRFFRLFSSTKKQKLCAKLFFVFFLLLFFSFSLATAKLLIIITSLSRKKGKLTSTSQERKRK